MRSIRAWTGKEVNEGFNYYALKIAMNLQGASPNTTEQPSKNYTHLTIIYYVAFTKFCLAYLSHIYSIIIFYLIMKSIKLNLNKKNIQEVLHDFWNISMVKKDTQTTLYLRIIRTMYSGTIFYN